GLDLKQLTILLGPRGNPGLPQSRVGKERPDLILLEGSMNLLVNEELVDPPRLTERAIRLLLDHQRHDQLVPDADRNERRSVIGLTAVKAQDYLVTLAKVSPVPEAPLYRSASPFGPVEQRILGGDDHVVEHATNLRGRGRPVQNLCRQGRQVVGLPRGVTIDTLENEASPVGMQRGLRVSLSTHVKHTRVLSEPRPDLLLLQANTLKHGVLARLVSVRNHKEVTARLEYVVLQNIVKLRATLRRNPVLRIVSNLRCYPRLK